MWLILTLLIVVYILWRFNKAVEDDVDKLPGPRRLPFIGSVMDIVGKTQCEMFLLMREYHKKFGDRFTLKAFSRKILVLSHPNDIEIVLSHARNITKSKHYTYLVPWLGTGLLISTGTKWHKRRKVLTPSFHFNILKNFSKVMEEKSRNLVHKLEETRGSEVDLVSAVSDFTLFTICETAMGTKLDSDKSAATIEYKKAIMDIGKLIFSRVTSIWLRNDFIFKKSLNGQQFEKSLSKVMSFTDDVIAERRQKRKYERDYSVEEDVGSKKKLAFLDMLLDAESRGEIDVEGIREEVNTFMFEGHDTTAMAITFALILLADHEDIQERVFEECRSIFGDSDRTSNTFDLAEMKYIEAVIKETLRLYPSVPFIGRIVTEDFTLGDISVKKNTEIGVQIYDLHRREDFYPEPELFKPERFLGAESKHPYAFVPFSAGPRNCIGQRFAMQEMKCVLSEVCRKFKLVPKQRRLKPCLLIDIVLRPTEPIYVRFISR